MKYTDSAIKPVPENRNPVSVLESGNPVSNAGSASAPGGFEKRILLCVAGLSPQVITESLYALATREDKFIPTEIHIITTAEGAGRIHLTLFEDDQEEQHFYRLCADLDLNPMDIRFNADTIHRIGRQPDDNTPLSACPAQAGLDDIRSIGDNEAAADTITAIVRDLTADPQAAIHASIAGGRKTMGFYLGYAMSLFGREQDRLSHVLVSPPFESHNQFYYPPKKPKVLRDRNDRPIHTRDAEITLADIPFVRLRGHLDKGILGGSMSYSETVSRTQHNVNPPKLILDSTNKTIQCGGYSIPLAPSLFAFYTWFARRLLAGKPGIHWSQDGLEEEYLEEYARIVGEHSAEYDNACVSLKKGMDEDFIDPKTSKINKQLEETLGKEPARPYLISKTGIKPGTRYGLKGLTLKKEQVRFLEE